MHNVSKYNFSFGLLISCLFISFSFDPHNARAAQDAEIAVEDAGIYESPDSNSVLLEQLSQGSKIRIGNSATDGWYKTLLSRSVDGRKTGWIQDADININPITEKSNKVKKKKSKKKKRKIEEDEEDDDEEEIPRRRSAKRPKFPFIGGFVYTMGKTSPTTYQAKLGTGQSSFYAKQYGVRVLYRGYPKILFGGSMDFYTFSESGSPSAVNTTGTIKYSGSATLITALGEYEFYQKAPFFFGGGVGLGGVFGKAGNTTALGTTIETTSLFSLQLQLKLFARAYFAQRWNAQLDLGYRNMKFADVPYLNSVNETSGAKLSETIDLAGLMIGIGVGYDF